MEIASCFEWHNLRKALARLQVLLLSVPNPEKTSQAVFPTINNPFVHDLASRLAASAGAVSEK